MNVWADVKKISAGESVGVLVGSVTVVSEGALERGCEVIAVLSVRLRSYVGVDVGHVDFCKVLAGCVDDGVDIDVMLMGRRGCIQGNGLCLVVPHTAAPWV